jgi:hypothetical protein
MKATETYSHLNGLEYLMVRKPSLWQEVEEVVSLVDATQCRTTTETEEANQAETRYDAGAVNEAFRSLLISRGWEPSAEIGCMRDRVAIELQFGTAPTRECSLFAVTLAFYVGDHIDVGIEILPMKSLQMEMSSGVPYYEGELYNVIRQGRGVPAVPLLIIGVEP